ncbi:hypothetical protein [Bacillus subtilis]|nr:hypothetical protein [Bacillus subtilis]
MIGESDWGSEGGIVGKGVKEGSERIEGLEEGLMGGFGRKEVK